MKRKLALGGALAIFSLGLVASGTAEAGKPVEAVTIRSGLRSIALGQKIRVLKCKPGYRLVQAGTPGQKCALPPRPTKCLPGWVVKDEGTPRATCVRERDERPPPMVLGRLPLKVTGKLVQKRIGKTGIGHAPEADRPAKKMGAGKPLPELPRDLPPK